MSKTLNFDFHTIVVPEGSGRDFGDILRNAEKIVALPDRNREVDAYPVRWEEIRFNANGSKCHGEVVKIRMHNLPSKAGMKTRVQDLELKGDEGLGEGVAFMFEETRSLLVVQRNRYGLTASSLVGYFCNLTGVSRPVLVHPLVSAQGLERLLGMHEVKRFDFKVAMPRAYHGQRAAATSTIAALDMLEQSGAANISVSLSVGTRKKLLNLSTIKNWGKFLNGLLQQTGQSVKYINVRGTDGNGTPTSFNVLENQLCYSEDFQDMKKRRVPLTARIKMLDKAVLQQKDELKKLFGPDGDGN